MGHSQKTFPGELIEPHRYFTQSSCQIGIDVDGVTLKHLTARDYFPPQFIGRESEGHRQPDEIKKGKTVDAGASPIDDEERIVRLRGLAAGQKDIALP